jgi:hypothetical protein
MDRRAGPSAPFFCMRDTAAQLAGGCLMAATAFTRFAAVWDDACANLPVQPAKPAPVIFNRNTNSRLNLSQNKVACCVKLWELKSSPEQHCPPLPDGAFNLPVHGLKMVSTGKHFLIDNRSRKQILSWRSGS